MMMMMTMMMSFAVSSALTGHEAPPVSTGRCGKTPLGDGTTHAVCRGHIEWGEPPIPALEWGEPPIPALDWGDLHMYTYVVSGGLPFTALGDNYTPATFQRTVVMTCCWPVKKKKKKSDDNQQIQTSSLVLCGFFLDLY